MIASESSGFGPPHRYPARVNPETHYARVDGLYLAYQVLGEGAIDLVLADQWVSHQEAQWDVPHSHERQAVTACLAERRHGEAILASMGSLAHYMQELSSAGFQIADFVHEGNGEIWVSALKDPARYVGWILTEEQAEGGDELAKRAVEHPAFVSAFSRVCSGGGVALYRINSGLPIASAAQNSGAPATTELPDARPMRASDSSLRTGTPPVPGM
jgi:hypothetical protein